MAIPVATELAPERKVAVLFSIPADAAQTVPCTSSHTRLTLERINDESYSTLHCTDVAPRIGEGAAASPSLLVATIPAVDIK